MPRRRRHGVVAPLALVALAAGLAACQADSGNANCQLVAPVTLAGTALTLLPNARLDQVAGRYFLLGSDGTSVRWAAVSSGGTLSDEQAYALPSGITQPYFAMAGLTQPGDTVVIGYLATDATTGDGELAVIAVPADGSSPAAPAAPVVTFPGGVPSQASPTSPPVAMSSSRLGNVAGLAWIDSVAQHVMLATVDGTGALTSNAPSDTSVQAGPGFSCLGFSPGNNALTVTYYAGATSVQQEPGWIVAEANEAGSITLTTSLVPGRAMGTCALVSPTADGYALVWQDSEGGWVANFSASSNVLTTNGFGSASSFGGPSLQPPISGLAPFGTDFGVLFSRSFGGELWRIDAAGNRRPGALELPSAFGNIGSISSLPIAMANGEALVATYADYTNSSAAPAAGSRWFVNAVCY
jgi:hypothetical protein